MLFSGLRIEVAFQPHQFEKPIVEQTKNDIRDRLAGHELGRLKIVLKKPEHASRITLQFLGDPQTVEKARGLLGVY